MTTNFITTKEQWLPKPAYRKRALDKVVNQACYGIFLDPGMGKTSIILEGYRKLKAANAVDCMLVLGPLRPVSVSWKGELDKWSNFEKLTCTLLHGRYKEERSEEDHDIYLANWEILNNLWKIPKGFKGTTPLSKWVRSKGRVMLVVDESGGLRNTQTKRFKTIKSSLSLFARRYVLTGTPTPNGIEGLFGQLYTVDEGLTLGRFITHFRRDFMYPDPSGWGWRPMPDAYDRVVEVIKNKALRLNAEDHLKLPEYVYNDIIVELPKAVKNVYNELRREMIALIGDATVITPNSGALITKLRQIAGGAMYTDQPNWQVLHDEKINALQELVGELNGAPCLLFYQFAHDYERIIEKFKDVPTISGTSPAKAELLCKDFNAGNIPILAGHPASMGHGLNLQEGNACHMIWYNPTYDLEHWEQSLQRLRRSGNTSSHVHVHSIIAGGTVDTAIQQARQSKDSSQRQFLNLLKTQGAL